MKLLKNILLALLRFVIVEFMNLVWLGVSLIWAFNVSVNQIGDLFLVWLTLVLLVLTFGRGMAHKKRIDRKYQVGKTRLEQWAEGKEASDG